MRKILSKMYQPKIGNSNMLLILFVIVYLFSFNIQSFSQEHKHTFEIGEKDFLLDGQPFQIRCGELHFARIPREYWQHRIQMMKAMGLNTICAYLFWNFHERTPGKFTWDGRADVREFCKIAQEEGLWVILRPGPYACAEWEMGGLPWWLLKNENIKLRSKDPLYINSAKNYLNEVGRILGPLQITNGGPIIMVQVENEYGFYADDAEYMGIMRQVILDAGFNVPLFDCNPPYHLKKGLRNDLFHVVNFGSNPEQSFKALREILPTGPLMCGEFYSGWFDTWGNPHTYGEIDQYLNVMEYMLKTGASFSIYMAHGGTTFGFWAGDDRPFKPDVSSYDYGAPVSEAGWTTKKFFETRKLISKYLMSNEPPIPEPPALNPTTTFSPVKLTQFASIFEDLPEPVITHEPKTMEFYDQPRGSILYRTVLPAGEECKFEVEAVHDFAWVFLNGVELGVLDRRKQNTKINIPKREKESVIDILVHAMGRINFGPEVHDRKGLIGPLRFIYNKIQIPIQEWKVYNLEYEESMLRKMNYDEISDVTHQPGIWKGEINIDEVGDVFIDMSKWGKGVAWVNDHCLGRFWNIGPTQTMYIPAPWLNRGTNEVFIMDLLGPEEPIISGLDQPILNELHPEKDFTLSKRKEVKLNIDNLNPFQKGEFNNTDEMQTVTFPQAAKGRYFCIDILSTFNNSKATGIAEIDLLDENEKPISHQIWTIAYVNSEELIKENGTAENAIDGQTFNGWISAHDNSNSDYPVQLVIDLGKEEEITGFRYVPIAKKDKINKIKDYQIFIGNNLIIEE